MEIEEVEKVIAKLREILEPDSKAGPALRKALLEQQAKEDGPISPVQIIIETPIAETLAELAKNGHAALFQLLDPEVSIWNIDKSIILIGRQIDMMKKYEKDTGNKLSSKEIMEKTMIFLKCFRILKVFLIRQNFKLDPTLLQNLKG